MAIAAGALAKYATTRDRKIAIDAVAAQPTAVADAGGVRDATGRLIARAAHPDKLIAAATLTRELYQWAPKGDDSADPKAYISTIAAHVTQHSTVIGSAIATLLDTEPGSLKDTIVDYIVQHDNIPLL